MPTRGRQAGVCLLSQRRDRSMQDLIQQQTNRPFDDLAVGLGQLAVEPAEQVREDSLPFGLEISGQLLDHRAVGAPGPVLEEALRFLLDDRLGWRNVLE